MNARDLRNMSGDELGEELLKLRRAQFGLRIQAVTGQGVKPDQHGKIRKDIARIKTVLRERVGNETESDNE